MDEANVRLNATALSVFRSACGCLSDAPVSIVASSRCQLWCVSPQEAVPATLCIFECAAATWFAAWASAATSVDMENYARIQMLLQNQSYMTSAESQVPPSLDKSYDPAAPSARTLGAHNEDTVSVLLSHVPACWVRSIFHSQPPSAARQRNETRVEAALYTVGSSKRNAAAMVPRVLVLSSVSTAFAHCLANTVVEHGGRCGTLPEASVFESLSSVRGEIVARSVQMPYFTVAPEAGIDRVTAQMPVLAETLALFEGSVYKPCVVQFHAAAMWTTAENAASDFAASLGSQCVTMTQQAVFFLSLPAHLPHGEESMMQLAQLDSHFCAGARLRLYDLESVILCDDTRTVLLVSRNGCASSHRRGGDTVLTAPCVALRVHFPARESRAVFVSGLMQQCEKLKHAVVVDTDLQRAAPKTVLDMRFLHTLEGEVVDIGSAVAVADTDYCTSIEASTRPMWPVTFPVFADGFELCEFWKLLSLQTATLLVKLSRVVPKSAHSSMALRIATCVTDIVGDRWGRAFLIHRAATVVANFAALEATEQQNPAASQNSRTTAAQTDPHQQQQQFFSEAGRAAVPEQQRRDDATLSVQVLRFLVVECCVHIARTAMGDSAHVVQAKDAITAMLRDVEALTLARPVSTTDRNVPSVRWDRIQEQVLLVLVEGALALGADPDLTLQVVAPFANAKGPFGSGGGVPTAETLALAKVEASRHAPLADLSRMDTFMSTALASFPSSLFCATHPLPALWRLVRPFMIPLLRSFFTRESFDSLFPSTTDEMILTPLMREQNKSIGVHTEEMEVQTVDSPLWKLLRNSNSAEIESATAGQIYLNRLFGNKSGGGGEVLNTLRGATDDISRPSAPIVEDWLQLATLTQPQNITAAATRQIQMQREQQQQQQQAPPSFSPLSLHRQSSGIGFGSSDYLGNTPSAAGGIIHTPAGGTPMPGSTPLQATLPPAGGPSHSQLQQLERRDLRIGELELKEQSLQATISALHDELSSTRSEVAQLLAERREARATLFRERCDHLVEKEVTERRLLLGQEEVDRCGLHNFLIDRALFESVSLMGDAAYRLPGASTRMPPPRIDEGTNYY